MFYLEDTHSNIFESPFYSYFQNIQKTKIMKNAIMFSFLFVIIGCSPRFTYLGDTYTPNLNIDVFYDEGDVKRNFEVIGILSGNTTQSLEKSIEKAKDKMIAEGGKKGAQGIIFFDIMSIEEDNTIIKAKLIRYIR